VNAPTDPLELRFAALARTDDDSDWNAVRRRRSRPALAMALGVFVLAALGAGAAFGLYEDVLPFASQPPAPKPVVRDFRSLFGGEYAPPGMDPHVLAGETRLVATYRNGRRRYTLYVAPTKTGGFCETFTHLFGGCRQARTLPPGAHAPPPGEINSYAIGLLGVMSSAGATILGGDLLLPPGTTLSVDFADGTSIQVPVTYVSPPIDAGFFLYPGPHDHVRPGREAISLTARDRNGKVLAKALVLPTTPPGPTGRSRTTR
jgi:hypothetical protein